METSTEVSLLPSEQAAIERRVCARRQAMLSLGVVANQANKGGSRDTLEDYGS